MNKGLYEKKDIYIIKNDINNKVYIGQAVNMKERWYRYSREVKRRPNHQLIIKAMNKYGIEHFWMECLESQVENYDEREQYWIKYYDCQVPNGYNVAPGGQGSGAGTNSIASKIKDEKILQELILKLKENKLTLTEIAKEFGISITTVVDINKGRYYKRHDINYPIRPIHQNYYTEELLKQITYSLKYELDKSLQEIAKEYQIDCSQLSEINTGKIHYRDWITYPIRQSKEHKMENLAPLIVQDLKDNILSQKEIAKKYNVSANSISNINLGRVWIQPNTSYPIRKNGQFKEKKDKFIDKTSLCEILNLLSGSTISMRKIAQQYNVSLATIQGINNGTTKKYRLDDIEYPLRKK